MDRAPHVGLLHDHGPTGRTGLADGGAAELGLVTTGPAVRIALGVAAATSRHLLERRGDGVEERLALVLGQGDDLAPRVEPRGEEDVLEDAVPEPRDALLGRQQRVRS
jgi:hypothetical protein